MEARRLVMELISLKIDVEVVCSFFLEEVFNLMFLYDCPNRFVEVLSIDTSL